MKVFTIGVGYVGLVTSACLAELGHEVCGVDIDEEKIKKLREGKSPIYEPGLDEILKKNIEEGRLTFQVGIDEKINDYDLAIIGVGTPERAKDGKADLYYVGETAKQIARNVKKDKFIVVTKSTVPIGTADQIKKSLEIYNTSGTKFSVGSNPETLREGNAVGDFMKPDRIIIGGDQAFRETLLKLYEKIDCEKVLTDAKSSEMVKLASNFMLALRLSATNMLSRICDMTGANIEEVMRGVGLDKRIGPAFLKAGVGFGGSCFPKDNNNIKNIALQYRLDGSIFEAVTKINSEQWQWFCSKVEEMSLLSLNGKKIAIWGLAFKPNTDDIREAPSINVINWLLEEKVQVQVYDPVARVDNIFGDKISYFDDMYQAIEGADMLLIITEWDQFKQADLKKVKELLEVPKIVDGRNIYDSEKIRELGFEYASMGRP